ncbi:tRNA pseudouridine(55) synthase TruB [Fructobacillus parabroussonetiae]|uniref:tRNA pseudouridine synthase B n=1 Tax=Fructobacillus parabroussonetiae TaxID=2713174 RepID=A0ABS5QWL5_9LACO|nr:tRNA pseudouridine(55) synthase TruB [Fructobacillus parabroussonetiae]MBS9337187.1 tRNA pseudouridine(55) synthase TruB [Fructobacillus parabroussonetiae]
MAKQASNLSGLLVVNKPKKMTSFGVVARLRRISGQKKIGHAGTLDPNVDGVLVVALGKATKLIDLLQTRPKTYRGTVTFGYATESQDADGAVVEEKPLTEALDEDKLQAAFSALEGDIVQVPPIYSAVKVNGKRLYEYARAGEEVTLPKRSATIYRFRPSSRLRWVEGKPYQSIDFEATVSKGTYIRTLAYDLGQSLGLPATMTKLTRTSGSGFDLSEATDLDDLMALTEESIVRKVKPIASVLTYERKDLTDEEYFAVKNGQKIQSWAKNNDGFYQLYYHNQLIAVYAYSEDEQLWRSRYFFA